MGMTVEKYSASMDVEMLAAAREAASEEGLTLSAWLAEAARHRLRLHGLRQTIAEYEAEFGEITGAELDETRHEIAEARRRR